MGARYHIVSIWLHWLIALLIISNLASGLMMESEWVYALSFNDRIAYYQWHKTFGILVLLLSVFRLFWRLTHKAPPLPEHMPAYEKFAAHASHWALYFFMFALPLSGWALVSASTLGIPTMLFNAFEWPHLPLPEAYKGGDMAKLAAEIHEIMAYILLVLLGVHVAAAIRHHVLLKDDVLTRMLPGRDK